MTVLADSTPPHSTALARATRPAAVGAVLGLIWLAGLYGWLLSSPTCGQAAGWGCVGLLYLLFKTAPFVGSLLGWGLLRRVAVRPAWHVALAGGVIAWLAIAIYESASGEIALKSPLLPLLLAASYAAGSYIVAPATQSSRRLAAAAVLLLLWSLNHLLAPYLASHRAAAIDTEALSKANVPLVAPDLGKYRLRFPSANTYSRELNYQLIPADQLDHGLKSISVTVEPQQPGFDPPSNCRLADVDLSPCEQLAPDIWRKSVGTNVWYITRREGVIVQLSPSGSSIPDNDLRNLAASMAPRKPDYFVGN